MRKILSLSVMTIVLMASCSSNNDPESMGDTKESSINATSYTTWYYYSFVNDTVVGKGEETTADNALWAKRADWDFAVCRYSVKTNSGSSTSVNAVGGVYTFASTEVFSNILSLPDNIQFVVDSTTVTRGMAAFYIRKHMQILVLSISTLSRKSRFCISIPDAVAYQSLLADAISPA